MFCLFRQEEHIPLERKRTREDPSVGGHVMKRVFYPIFNVTACARVFSSTFSLQEDIIVKSASIYRIPNPESPTNKSVVALAPIRRQILCIWYAFSVFITIMR